MRHRWGSESQLGPRSRCLVDPVAVTGKYTNTGFGSQILAMDEGRSPPSVLSNINTRAHAHTQARTMPMNAAHECLMFVKYTVGVSLPHFHP